MKRWHKSKYNQSLKRATERYFALIVLSSVVIIWLSSWVYLNHKNFDYPTAGQFGDKFGFVNSLFSGLAFGGIIISLFYQRTELNIQKVELRETRDQFKKQIFESTFFNLLKNQSEISKRIDATFYGLKNPYTTASANAEGLKFFSFAKRQLVLIYNALERTEYEKFDQEYYEDLMRTADSYAQPGDEQNNNELLEKARMSYSLKIYAITEENHRNYKGYDERKKMEIIYNYFIGVYQSRISNYFRHLYYILNFVKENHHKELTESSTKEQKNIEEINLRYYRYAQFIQAQMTDDELVLLFYNCVLYPMALELVSKYNLLESLNPKSLVSLRHDCVTEIKLKASNK